MVPRVLTMRELRAGLSQIVDEVTAGHAVFAGAHRKPEVVVMSVRQYEELTLTQERAVRSAVASLQMEGMDPTEVEVAAARELAAGRIDFAEYTRRAYA